VLAKIAAMAIHEIERRIVAPVAAEYRKLGAQPRCQRRHADDPPVQLPSVVSAGTERAASWDHDRRVPAVAAQERFGFSHPAR
jgi:hypothetical protein